VVRWYREHSYNFVSITDLNYFTPTAGLAAVFEAPGRSSSSTPTCGRRSGSPASVT